MRSSPRAWPSMPHSPRWSPPRPPPSVVVVQHDGLATICCCASARGSRTCSAFLPTHGCPSVESATGAVALGLGELPLSGGFRHTPVPHSQPCAPFPVAARQTGRADFLHPAFSRPVIPSLSTDRRIALGRR